MDEKTYEVVVNYTKNEILAGRLTQGQKLPPERVLAEQLGVGRTSVREALRVMEILGLIVSVQGAGNFVANNFENSMVEILSMMFLLKKTEPQKLNEVRACLEIKAAELAAQNATAQDVVRLSDILKKMELSQNEMDDELLDKQLHGEIAAASGNELLRMMLNSLSALTDHFITDIRHGILEENDNKNRLNQIHKDIATAIINGDKAAVGDALARHNEIIYENLDKIL